MPVHARQLIRKMRGGAQAHLIEASDGQFYVVKFQNNPQHRRILINEWIASAVFRYLQIQTPVVSVIELTREFLIGNEEISIQLGLKKVPVEPGWHFGSRYPGHPHRLAVYDFLPDQLIDRVHNVHDFLAAFVADKWLGNSDARQAVFFRAQIREFASDSSIHPLKKSFLVQMIDHGFAFNGPLWTFEDSPLHGLYFRHMVYRSVKSMDCFEPWLSRVTSFPVEALDEAIRSMPPAWVAEDAPAVDALIEKLLKRRQRVADLLCQTTARVNPFPGWIR